MNLSIQLLGTLQIRIDGETAQLPTRKAGALVAYLALHRGESIPRDRLADYFWPDGHNPRANLRAELARLRSALGDVGATSQIFDVQRNSLSLSSEGVEVDLWRIERLLNSVALHPHLSANTCRACCERLATAVDLYQAPLLDEFDTAGSADVETEVAIRRAELERQILAALETLGVYLSQTGDHRRVIAYARRHLALQPGLEEPARRLMMAYTFTNRRRDAQAVYEELAEQLAQYGTTPSASLSELYQQIRTGPTTARQIPLASPYPGLAAFGPDDAHNFFGREWIIERLFEAVSTQPTTLLIGPSGIGKSSVVYAGLVPQLMQLDQASDAQTPVVAFRPGRAPLENLAQAIYPAESPAAGAARIERTLRQGEVSLRRMIADALSPAGSSGPAPAPPPLLIADQFEEMFTLCEDETLRRLLFSGLLEADKAGEHRLSVLLVLRADFFGQALEHPAFAAIQPEQMILLGRMNNDQLHRAIAEPARQSGISFEPGLIERILDDLETAPGQLPLLQFALALLWNAHTERWITHEAYNDIEQVSGALTHYANGVVAGLSPEERVRVRRVLLQLVQLGENTEDTRRLATRREIGERDWPLVQRLADSRLVVTNRDSSGQETVEVIHEALIQEWRRLREWLNEDRAFHTWQTRARSALHTWLRSGRDVGALLRGPILVEAEGWLDDREAEMDEGLLDFVRASLTARDNEAERERRQRIALENALAESRRMERRALVRQLSAQADQLMQRKPDLALLLAAEALTRSHESRDRTDLLVSLDVNPFLEKILHGHGAPVFYLALSADGRRLISCDEQHNIRLWETDTFLSRPFIPAPDEKTLDVALDGTGRWFATVHPGKIRLWQSDTLTCRILIPMHSREVFRLRFSTDGRYLLSIAIDGELSLWDTESGALQPQPPPLPAATSTQLGPDAHLLATLARVEHRPGVLLLERRSGSALTAPLLGHAEQIHGLTLSPTDDRLATASFDGDVRIWDTSTGRETFPALHAHAGRALFAAFSADGRLLATGGTDNLLHLWDSHTGKKLGIRPLEHRNWVRCAFFSKDGSRLYSGDSDGKVYVWNLARYRAIGGHTKRVRTVAVSPDGQTLATISLDGRVGIWARATHQPIAFLEGGPTDAGSRELMTGLFSPDGRYLAAADNLGNLLLWETATWRLRTSGRNLHNEPSIALAFSPDSQLIAQGDLNGLVSVRTTTTGEIITPPLPLHSGANSWILAMAISPDGKTLATGSREHIIAFWSLPDLRPAGPAFVAHSNWVTHLLYSSDGNTLISTGADGYVRFWDPKTGAEQGPGLAGHPGQVWQAAFAPGSDERVLITLGGDGSVFWWDRATRTPTAPPLRTTTETESMAVGPEGQWVYLGSFDNTAHGWRVESGPWIGRAKAIANRELTPAERLSYLGENRTDSSAAAAQGLST